MLTRPIESLKSDIKQLFLQIKAEEKNENYETVYSILEKAGNGLLISSDEWSLLQETLPLNHPCANFFADHRNALTLQLSVEGRKCVSVPIITFMHENQNYILLMENKGLEKSAHVKEVQWTAHGVRVDKNEKELLDSPDIWSELERIGDDTHSAAFIAAAVRRIKEMGIDLERKDFSNIHPIDRIEAGLIEKDAEYKTEYFDVNLGERNPSKMMEKLTTCKSRHGQWTKCFKISDLKAEVKESKDKPRQYLLSHNGKTTPVRTTTWSFIKALQLLNQTTVHPDSILRDTWQLRTVRPLETSLTWVRKRIDSALQFTLFFKENNYLSTEKIHVFAVKAKMNEEDFAYLSMRPERLVLHVIIALLTVKTKIVNSEQLENTAKMLYNLFFMKNSSISRIWEEALNKQKIYLSQLKEFVIGPTIRELSPEEIKDLHRIRSLLAILEGTELSEHHRTIYSLQETNLEIALTILLYEKNHAVVFSDIRSKVNALFEMENKLERLEQYPLADRLFFGVTGPIASGKSTCEKIAKSMLNEKSAAFVSSDEWNKMLSECLHLDQAGFGMHRGNLTLSEAWYIKVLIWNLINEMEKKGAAPNVIQEACDPAAIEGISMGQTIIFINTADPTKAAERVKARGDISGRYVSASSASSSYRWPWINFIATLKKKTLPSSTLIKIIDTDIYHSTLSLDRAQIATMNIFNRVLEIHNLNHFLFFIARGFKVNPAPNSAKELWLPKSTEMLKLLLGEIKKLFEQQDSTMPNSSHLCEYVVYEGVKYKATRNKSEIDLYKSKNSFFVLIENLYRSITRLETVRLFSTQSKKECKDVIEVSSSFTFS